MLKGWLTSGVSAPSSTHTPAKRGYNWTMNTSCVQQCPAAPSPCPAWAQVRRGHLRWFPSTVWKFSHFAARCLLAAFPFSTWHCWSEGKLMTDTWYWACLFFRKDLLLCNFLYAEFLTWVKWSFQESVGSRFTPTYYNDFISSSTLLRILTSHYCHVIHI